MRYTTHKYGYTALEILVVVAILGLLVGIILPSVSAFRNQTILSVETENVVSLITKARTDTLSSKNDTVYGVHFESGRAVLFKGSSFSEPDPDNIEVTLDDQLVLTDISLQGGGNNVVFKRLSGATDEHGTIKVTLPGVTNSSSTITIHGTGLVDIN